MRELLQYAQQCQKLYQKSFQSVGQDYDLSQNEIDLLLFLWNNPELNTARDVSVYRGMAPSNVSAAIKRLRQESWLRVEPDRVNHRIKRLEILGMRETAMEELVQCQEACFAAILGEMEPREVETLRSLLSYLGDNINRALQEME